MMIRLSLRRKLLWGGMFALAMGYFEAALVQYLRELYYPDGFVFPLVRPPERMMLIELGREAASILMLASVGVLLGSGFIDRFAGFAFCFGVWDIGYYLFLELFEGWPSSPGTMDVLFLIPLVWVGPVWAPVAVSAALIWGAVTVWRRLDRGRVLRPTALEWVLEVCAALVIVGSFLAGGPGAAGRSNPSFPWWLWAAGVSLGVGIFIRILRRGDGIDRSGNN